LSSRKLPNVKGSRDRSKKVVAAVRGGPWAAVLRGGVSGEHRSPGGEANSGRGLGEKHAAWKKTPADKRKKNTLGIPAKAFPT